MDSIDLSIRRRAMGRSLGLLSSAGPQPLCADGAGYWIAMSGAASSDANVALVDTRDPTTRNNVLGIIDGFDQPATVVLAGDALETDLGDAWHYQGDMPLMEITLSTRDVRHDSRVRAASAGDVDAVSELLSSAYGIERDESDAVAAFAHHERDDGTIWLLVDESVAVATVFTAIIEDAVCVWSLATPERYGRHGYATALLDDVLARARDAGVSVGLLAATPEGASLYRRVGWRTIESWRMFTR